MPLAVHQYARPIPIPRIVVPRNYTARSRPVFSRGRGFGDFNQTVNTAASIAQNGAQATALMLTQMGVVAGPVGALIGAAAGALIQIGSLIAKQFQGCGQTCVIASQDANQVGDYMLQNLRAYVAAPYNPTLQAAALNNFDTAWAALSQACSNLQLGDAGRRCISDRQQGACVWKASPGGWQPDGQGGYTWKDWGAAGSGDACWNYFVGFRDPIANDPRAALYSPVSSTSITQTGSSIASAVGLNPETQIGPFTLGELVIPGLLIGAGLLL